MTSGRARLAALALSLSCGSTAESTAVQVNIELDQGAPRPQYVLLSWLDAEKFVLRNVWVPTTVADPERKSRQIGTAMIRFERDKIGQRRLIGRGFRDDAVVAEGARRVLLRQGANEPVTLVLFAGTLPDLDGDEIPDQVDDCPTVRDVSGGCRGTADAGAPAPGVLDAPEGEPRAVDGSEPREAAADPVGPTTAEDARIAEAAAAPRDGPPSVDLQAGLVGHWKFDEGQGSRVADSSGRGHDGALFGDPAWTPGGFSAAQFPNPFSLSVAGDHLRVARTPALEPAAFTISLWIKRNGVQPLFACLVRKNWRNSAPPTFASYGLHLNPSNAGSERMEFVTGHPGTFDGLTTPPAAIPDLAWVHLAAVYDPSGSPPQKRIYVNGALSTSKTVTSVLVYDSAATGDLYVGQNPVQAGQYFKGQVDDLRLYDRALAGDAISALATGR